MLSTGVPKVSVKICHVEMEALGIQPDVKQRDHACHYDQKLEKKKKKEQEKKCGDIFQIWFVCGRNEYILRERHFRMRCNLLSLVFCF